METGVTWYFAYGSNMNPGRLAERGVPVARRVGGKLNGWRLTFDKLRKTDPPSGAGNIVAAAGEVVHGTLNDIPDAGFDALDRFEGVTGGHYERRTVRVVRADSGEPVEAITYAALLVGEGLHPTREYLGHLLAGRDLLPTDYWERLNATATLD